MTTIFLNVQNLKAVALAASTESTRYYLQGVYVSLSKSGVRMVATNGHILLATYDGSKKQDETREIIIPSTTIKAFKPVKGQKDVELEQISASQWRLGGIIFTPIDGTFPDYRRVIPASTPKALDYTGYKFATKYLAIFENTARILGLDFEVYPNRGNPALVRFAAAGQRVDYILGVIMPTRAASYRGETPSPQWVAAS